MYGCHFYHHSDTGRWKNATDISVPHDVIAALGTQKKPKVVVTVTSYTYRSTIAAYGEVFMLPVSQEHCIAAGITTGDQIEVMHELDTVPCTVEVPR